MLLWELPEVPHRQSIGFECLHCQRIPQDELPLTLQK